MNFRQITIGQCCTNIPTGTWVMESSGIFITGRRRNISCRSLYLYWPRPVKGITLCNIVLVFYIKGFVRKKPAFLSICECLPYIHDFRAWRCTWLWTFLVSTRIRIQSKVWFSGLWQHSCVSGRLQFYLSYCTVHCLKRWVYCLGWLSGYCFEYEMRHIMIS